MAGAVLLAVAASVSVEVRRALAAMPYRSTASRRSPVVLEASGVRAANDSLYHAVFVAQRADCNGNLWLANLLASTRVRERTKSLELLIQGTARDTLGIRLELPYALRNTPIRLLRSDEQTWLHDIGYHATPILLLFDSERRLRMASHVDANPVARVALGRAIAHLVTDDPSH